MPRFFSPLPIVEHARFALDARIAQHVRVLRMREGELITLFDGAGGEVPANVIELGKRDVLVETQARVAIERELARRIVLCVGLIANDRLDWLIQKATELGVAEIQPLYTERSQRIPGDVEKRRAHWQAVAISACEQCGRNVLPTFQVPMSINEALQHVNANAMVLMDAEGELSASVATSAASVAVFVGPEGGFSPNELSVLRAQCTDRMRIGTTVLRAETAAIAALVRVG